MSSRVDVVMLQISRYILQVTGCRLQAKAMEGEYISMILNKPAMNYCFWRNIWNIIWNICWIWFLACEYQNKSTHISFFICFICDGNLLLLREDPSQIWNQWKHLWSGHPDGFEEISLVSACRSISTYSGSIVFSLCERGELLYVRTPDEYVGY